ncbi:MAG: hypothetical protein WD874_00750 [Parcubacteria group bacterium]
MQRQVAPPSNTFKPRRVTRALIDRHLVNLATLNGDLKRGEIPKCPVKRAEREERIRKIIRRDLELTDPQIQAFMNQMRETGGPLKAKSALQARFGLRAPIQ